MSVKHRLPVKLTCINQTGISHVVLSVKRLVLFLIKKKKLFYIMETVCITEEAANWTNLASVFNILSKP